MTRPNPPSIGAYEGGLPLNVPSVYPTIQTALNAAGSGQTVTVADGTYTGPGNVDLDFGGQNITLTSASGNPTRTLIDCGGSSASSHRGFYFHSGETSAAINGFTIKNGYNTYGGGLYNGSGCALALTRCIFTDSTGNSGGGLYNDGALTLANCTIADNTAQFAGAIENYNGGLTLLNDILYGDTAGIGSELYDYNGTATASDCDIEGGHTGTGNLNADPLFVNAGGGDLHLKPGSPCVGKGTTSESPTTTIDGQPRPNPPSIGAYEIGTGGIATTHLLWSNSDGKAAFWNVDGSGNVTGVTGYGPFSDSGSLWHATAMATGPDGVSHIVWNNPDGKVALWNVQTNGSVSAVTGFGPYAEGSSLWQASGVSVGPDNLIHLLWTNPNHKAAFWNVTQSGSPSVLAGYGPYFDGSSPWDAIGVSTGPDNVSHLLWRNPDGHDAFWSVSDANGSIGSVTGYGPYTDGSPSNLWGAVAVSTGPDNVSHLLWDNVDYKAAFWNVGSGDGSVAAVSGYGPYTDQAPSETWTATGLTAGPDGATRLLWNNADGKVALWSLGGTGSPSAIFGYGPYVDGAAQNVWTAVGVSAGS